MIGRTGAAEVRESAAAARAVELGVKLRASATQTMRKSFNLFILLRQALRAPGQHQIIKFMRPLTHEPMGQYRVGRKAAGLKRDYIPDLCLGGIRAAALIFSTSETG